MYRTNILAKRWEIRQVIDSHRPKLKFSVMWVFSLCKLHHSYYNMSSMLTISCMIMKIHQSGLTSPYASFIFIVLNARNLPLHPKRKNGPFTSESSVLFFIGDQVAKTSSQTSESGRAIYNEAWTLYGNFPPSAHFRDILRIIS